MDLDDATGRQPGRTGSEAGRDGPAGIRAIERYLHGEGRRTIDEVRASARAVAEGWCGDATSDREAVVGPLDRELGRRGLRPRLVDLLAGAAAAADLSLAATPVPGPPYVVATSTGPVLRGTASRDRLVVGIRVFEVVRGEPARYRLRAGGVEEVLDVALRPRP